jgi:hypothetical protein
LPSPFFDDAKSFAGWFKSLLFEKALCDKRQRIIKKLRHSVITFTNLTQRIPLSLTKIA